MLVDGVAAINTFISVAALILSVVSISWNIWSGSRQTRRQSSSTLNTHLAGIEFQLAKIPSAFKFHGISEEAIQACGITAEELAYLTASFTIGGIWHESLRSSKASRPYVPGDYRWNMCASPATRRAWPVLRQMIDAGPYRDDIDTIFQQLEQYERANFDKTALVISAPSIGPET